MFVGIWCFFFKYVDSHLFCLSAQRHPFCVLYKWVIIIIIKYTVHCAVMKTDSDCLWELVVN